MTKGLDYSMFIEHLNNLDDDSDCRLDEEQFKLLLEAIPISKAPNFGRIVFKGLKDEKTNTVSFNNIRVLYEAMFSNIKCKAMLLILFRGVAKNKERKLTLNQYLEIAKITNFDENIAKSNFKNLDENNTGKITYPQVAMSLFGLRVNPKSNPFKEIIEVRSPHSSCLLI